MRRVLAIGAITGLLVMPAGIARAGGGCHDLERTEKTFAEVVYKAGVDYKGLCTVPTVLHVQVGQPVTWTNRDPIEHTVTSGSGWWAGETLTQNQSFTHEFTEAGLYPYYCMLHPNMGGVVDVQGATPVAATNKVATTKASSGAGLAGASGVAGLLGGAALGFAFKRKQNGSSGEQA